MPARSSEQRVLPYDLVFGQEFESKHFPAIRDEAEQRGFVTEDLDQFLELQAAGAVLRDMLVEGAEPAVTQFGPLLYQAYHFWLSGKQIYELDDALFRTLTGELAPVGAQRMSVPAPAAYLRFPRHLLWARISEDATPEAVDGLFWTVLRGGGEPAAPVSTLEVLLVLGLLPGRPGFSVAAVAGRPADEPQGHWADAQARADGLDFANVLPGGELEQLRALETTGEVLKLVSRVFWMLGRRVTSDE